MGVTRPNNPTASIASQPTTASSRRRSARNPTWFRYKFDGDGETNADGPFKDGAAGRGRPWPIFDAERGNYAIAAAGNGAAGALSRGAEGLLDAPGVHLQQVWNPTSTLPADSDTPSGWAVTVPPGETPGDATGSMAPLNWAQGEYINLLADIAAGKVLDIPEAVCSRYYACPLAQAAGEVEVDIAVTATTQWGQYMYVTGDAPGARRLEPEPRSSGQFGELPGVEKRGQPRRRQHDPIQVLPQERRRFPHLGMLPRQQQLQRQPVARRAVIGPAPGE